MHNYYKLVIKAVFSRCCLTQSQSVVDRLVEITCQPAAEMPSSIKLQVLKCLSALLDYPVVIEIVLNLDNNNTV